jgi:hypothetical protein
MGEVKTYWDSSGKHAVECEHPQLISIEWQDPDLKRVHSQTLKNFPNTGDYGKHTESYSGRCW